MSSDNVYLFSEREIELEMERLLDIARKEERSRFVKILTEERGNKDVINRSQVSINNMMARILQRIEDGCD